MSEPNGNPLGSVFNQHSVPIKIAQVLWTLMFNCVYIAGSDVVSMKCKADSVDGGYILNGNKMWLSLIHI